MNNPECVAIGWNQTHRGHYDRPMYGAAIVDNVVAEDYWPRFREGELVGFDKMVLYGKASTQTIDQLITRLKDKPRICRIWKYFNDGSKKCIFYYEYDG